MRSVAGLFSLRLPFHTLAIPSIAPSLHLPPSSAGRPSSLHVTFHLPLLPSLSLGGGSVRQMSGVACFAHSRFLHGSVRRHKRCDGVSAVHFSLSLSAGGVWIVAVGPQRGGGSRPRLRDPACGQNGVGGGGVASSESVAWGAATARSGVGGGDASRPRFFAIFSIVIANLIGLCR